LKNKIYISDILVVLFLAVIHPLMPWKSHLPCIPDKVEILYRQPLQGDTTLLDKEIAEADYYLRVHTVTDDGYNLVAQHATQLRRKRSRLAQQTDTARQFIARRRIAAKDRPLVAVRTNGGYWRAGHFHVGPLTGKAIQRDHEGRIVSLVLDRDSIISAIRIDSLGTYEGQMDRWLMAQGQGTFDARDGSHYEGFYEDDQRQGFGFESSPHHQLRVGTWRRDKFLGEKLKYTNERIYGIDISRYQHEQGRHRFGINWRQLRITSLGKRHNTEGRTYPVSFVYIKATEATSIRNRYFAQDYTNARRQGIHVGVYHFFSLRTSPQDQAKYFLQNSIIRHDDFPPVLDVEPSDAQIEAIGGGDELLRRVRIWLQIVEQRTNKRPILYVSQMFINKYMANADDVKKHYNVWIARYGEYKPDVKLVYWQLCPDGRVNGINTLVDINVFNGYQMQFDEFVRTGFHQ
jgi:lysozyme